MLEKLDIRKAEKYEYEKVLSFYYDVIELEKDLPYGPMWTKGVYPTDEMIHELVENEVMYVGLVDGRIVSAMALNSEVVEGYDKVSWKVDAGWEEVFVLHLFGILPEYRRKGVSRAMLSYADDEASRYGKKAIRLDVLAGNLPAEKLYPGCGYMYIETADVHYEDTGWDRFLMFEKAVE